MLAILVLKTSHKQIIILLLTIVHRVQNMFAISHPHLVHISYAHFCFVHSLFTIFAESPDTLKVLFNLLSSSSLDPPRVKLTYAVQKNETKCRKGILM